jgi:hypothetical protein
MAKQQRQTFAQLKASTQQEALLRDQKPAKAENTVPDQKGTKKNKKKHQTKPR